MITEVHHYSVNVRQALYFDRYQKLLAPKMDPLRDSRVRSTLREEMASTPMGPSSRGRKVIIDVEKVDEE